MREKLQIHIPEPCHEDWNQMTTVEQGRYCSSCQKNVIDFTNQTDEEIYSFFNNYKGNACGRFNDEQLGRPIEIIELKSASSFLKYAAGLLLPAFLLVNKASGQFKDQLPKQVCLPNPDIAKVLSGRAGGINVVSSSALYVVRGIVIEAGSKKPIHRASVMIKGTNEGVITNEDGRFSIKVTSNKAILVYSSIGYEVQQVSAVQIMNQPLIEMKPAIIGMLGEVVVVGYTRKRKGSISGMMSVITHTRMLQWEKIKDTLLQTKVKVYPNPVSSSGMINISFPNVKPGVYQIRLINAGGQLFYSFQKQISGKNETEQIHLGNHILAGHYILQVMDEQKNTVQSSKLIVQ